MRGGGNRKEGGEGGRGKEGRGDREGGREVRERVCLRFIPSAFWNVH